MDILSDHNMVIILGFAVVILVAAFGVCVKIIVFLLTRVIEDQFDKMDNNVKECNKKIQVQIVDTNKRIDGVTLKLDKHINSMHAVK